MGQQPRNRRHDQGRSTRPAQSGQASDRNAGGQAQKPPRPERYFTEAGIPRHELFDAEAQAEAKRWAKIPASQVRRFYGQVQADRRRIELEGDKASDEEVRVAMALLKTATAYAAAREEKREPLADFAKHHAALVRTIDQFKVFCRHFEAVVAWHQVCSKSSSASQ